MAGYSRAYRRSTYGRSSYRKKYYSKAYPKKSMRNYKSYGFRKMRGALKYAAKRIYGGRRRFQFKTNKRRLVLPRGGVKIPRRSSGKKSLTLGLCF